MMLADRDAGECVCSRLEDGRVRVERADPIVHISVELLKRADLGLVLDGDLATIGDINTVTYRITERGAQTVEAVRVCPSRLALCGVPCGCRGSNPSHYPRDE